MKNPPAPVGRPSQHSNNIKSLDAIDQAMVRGSKCRKKEEEAKALAELQAISKNKTATERARALDAEIKAFKEKLVGQK